MRRHALWVSVALFLGAFVMRYITYHFITIPWIIFDEYVYLDLAKYIVRGMQGIHFVKDQLYPMVWPLFLAATTGFFRNPFAYYKASMIVVMVLSSLLPVAAYWYWGKRLVPALFLMVFPSLFLYSGSVMSETMYTIILFALMIVLRLMLQHDLHQPRERVAGAIAIGALLTALVFTRTFGLVVVAGYTSSMALYIWYQRALIKERRALLSLVGISIGTFLIGSLLLRFISIPGQLYDSGKYVQSATSIVQQIPLAVYLLVNTLTASVISLFWVLPFAFLWGLHRAMKERKHIEVVVRGFLLFTYLFSVGLTLVHMLKDAGTNPQYLLFTRYLDPILVLLGAYGVVDLWDYAKKKARFPSKLVVISLLFFLIYSILFLYRGSYKFGNVMPIYYWSNVKELFPFLVVFPTLLYLAGMAIALLKRKANYFLIIFTVGALWFTVLSIQQARTVPMYVQKIYAAYVKELVTYKNSFGFMPVMCRHESTLSDEFYYLYGFLNGRHQIVPCDKAPRDVRRIVVGAGTPLKILQKMPQSCMPEFSFSKGDVVYYCP